jgi:hypothetical protein
MARQASGLSSRAECAFPLPQFLPGQEGAGLREDSIESWHMITHDQVRAQGFCTLNMS